MFHDLMGPIVARGERANDGLALSQQVAAIYDLISDALLFGRLWYGEPDAVSNAIGYAKFYSRSRPSSALPL
jgi:hypothetical protein